MLSNCSIDRVASPIRSVKVPTAPRSIFGSVALKLTTTSHPLATMLLLTCFGCSCGVGDGGSRLGQRGMGVRQGDDERTGHVKLASVSTLSAAATIPACRSVA